MPPTKEEQLPWHAPAIRISQRLKLAEGKPRKLTLMAAMAQLDCGACGYLCDTYAQAIDSGAEKDVTRCTPGGAETAKMLKQILATVPASTSAPAPEIKIHESSTAIPAPTPVKY